MLSLPLKVIIAVLFSALAFHSYAHSGATGLVKERMDNFKNSKRSMKLMKNAIKENDHSLVALESEKLVRWGEVMHTYFPEGSNQKPSEALPIIWQEWSIFEEHRVEYLQQAQALMQSAESQDLSAIKSTYGLLAKSCKSCHERYKD
jgi:cytochrome c556